MVLSPGSWPPTSSMPVKPGGARSRPEPSLGVARDLGGEEIERHGFCAKVFNRFSK